MENEIEIILVRLYIDNKELAMLRKVAESSYVTIEDIVQSIFDKEVARLKELK